MDLESEVEVRSRLRCPVRVGLEQETLQEAPVGVEGVEAKGSAQCRGRFVASPEDQEGLGLQEVCFGVSGVAPERFAHPVTCKIRITGAQVDPPEENGRVRVSAIQFDETFAGPPCFGLPVCDELEFSSQEQSSLVVGTLREHNPKRLVDLEVSMAAKHPDRPDQSTVGHVLDRGLEGRGLVRQPHFDHQDCTDRSRLPAGVPQTLSGLLQKRAGPFEVACVEGCGSTVSTAAAEEGQDQKGRNDGENSEVIEQGRPERVGMMTGTSPPEPVTSRSQLRRHCSACGLDDVKAVPARVTAVLDVVRTPA